MESYLQLIPKGLDDYLAKYVQKIDTQITIKYKMLDPEYISKKDVNEWGEDIVKSYKFELIIKYGDLKHKFDLGFNNFIGLSESINNIEKGLEEYSKESFCSLNLCIFEVEKESDEIFMIKRCDQASNFKLKYYIISCNTHILITEEIFNKVIKAYKNTLNGFKHTKLPKRVIRGNRH